MHRYLLMLLACLPLAAAEVSVEDLAKETEAQCAATASQKPTPQLIEQKVVEAVALMEKEGEAAFPKFKGKASAFIFCGTYIWIHSQEDCRMLMHPVKYKLDGKEVAGFKDKNGKAFFLEMNEVAAKGGGWVDYWWPKPGEKDSSLKVSYVKQAKFGTKAYVVGCGVYDLTLEQIRQALGGK